MYALKAFTYQINELKVNDDGITTMEKFSGKTTYINIKNHHKYGCPLYVLDTRLQGTIGGLPKW